MTSKATPLPITPELTAVLRDILPCGGDDVPSCVMGWAAVGRHWRKIVAQYPNGWSLTVHFKRTGEVSSAKGSLRMVARAGAV